MGRSAKRTQKDVHRLSLELAIVLSAALASRLTLYTLTLYPISTDVWPLIHLSKTILSNPSSKIWDDTVFDGYNNKWPAVTIAAAITTTVTSLKLDTIYGTLLPSASTAAILLLIYTAARRLCRSRQIPSPSSLALLAFAPSIVLFTSSALKESYAYNFLALAIWALTAKKNQAIIITTLTVISLVISHPLTPLVLGIGLAIAAAIELVNHKHTHILPRLVLLSAIILAAYALYTTLYSHKAIKYEPAFQDIISYTLYLALAAYIAATTRTRSQQILTAATATIATLALLTLLPLLPKEYTNRTGIEPYIAAPLAAIAIITTTRTINCNSLKTIARGLAAATASLILFILLHAPEASTLIHRVAQYVIITLVLLNTTLPPRQSRILALTLFAIHITFLASLTAGNDEIAQPWLYSTRDLYIVEALKLANKEYTIACDAKYHYLLKTQTPQTKTILVTRVLENPPKRTLILITQYNLAHGFEIHSTLQRPPRNLETKLNNHTNKIIDISGATIYLAR